jgi:hypothetical protein
MVDLKATSAVPLTGLIPTACGARKKAVTGNVELADGKLTRAVTLGAAGLLIFTTARLALPLFATSARWRRLSTATETGPEATGQGLPAVPARVPIDPVHSDGVWGLSAGDVTAVPKLTTVMSFEALFATTATPAAVSIAIEDGVVPTGVDEEDEGMDAGGCTARFTTAIDPLVEPGTLFVTLMG